ncbi:MAG: flagellar hook-associated protein FlgK [Leptospirales bacterium]
MGSTFSGLEIARKGLAAHQQALQTTGHNITNANNKHYARQRVNISASDPLYNPSLNRANGRGMVGQGVEIQSIERIRDEFVDDRIISNQQEKSYWSVQKSFYKKIENILDQNAPHSINHSLNNLWKAFQDLNDYPEEQANRNIIKENANAVISNIHHAHSELQNLRLEADSNVRQTVNEINNISTEIRDLNERILKSKAIGDSPNDLMDRRDMLIEKLSQLADISVSRLDKDEIMVYIGGEMLIQGESQNRLAVENDPGNEGLAKVTWEKDGSNVNVQNGSLHGFLHVRDNVIKGYIDDIDLLAINLHDTINEIHRDGFSLTKETNIDFFEMRTLPEDINGNADLDNDGQIDSTTLFRVTGNNKVNAEQPVGLDGVLTFVKNDEAHTEVQISYRADDTLEDVMKRINKTDAGVVAYMNHEGKLALKATKAEDDSGKNFMLRHMEDSGELLVGFAGILQGSGEAGAFDYRKINEIMKLQSSGENVTFTPAFHPAGGISLNQEIKNNPGKIAAGSGTDVGGTGDPNQANGSKDGSFSLLMAQALRHNSNMVGNSLNTEDFLKNMNSRLGAESATAQSMHTSKDLLMQNLEQIRQSVMGVNMDEEMSNMVQFQHAYNASAKILQTMNEMLDYLINRLG